MSLEFGGYYDIGVLAWVEVGICFCR